MYFDAGMMKLIQQVAEPKHNSRVFDEVLAKWIRTIDACTDLPHRPDPITVKTLFVSVWGARRYLRLVEPPDFNPADWAAQTERICCAVLFAPADGI